MCRPPTNRACREFDCAPFYGVFVPKGTPQAIVDKLAEALNKGLNEELVKNGWRSSAARAVEQERRGPKPLSDLIKAEPRALPGLKLREK